MFFLGEVDFSHYQHSLLASSSFSRVEVRKDFPHLLFTCVLVSFFSHLVYMALLVRFHECSFSDLFSRHNPKANFLFLSLLQSLHPLFSYDEFRVQELDCKCFHCGTGQRTISCLLHFGQLWLSVCFMGVFH